MNEQFFFLEKEVKQIISETFLKGREICFEFGLGIFKQGEGGLFFFLNK